MVDEEIKNTSDTDNTSEEKILRALYAPQHFRNLNNGEYKLRIETL